MCIELFTIGKDTLNRWLRQYKATGTITTKKRMQYWAKKFSDDDLLAYVEQHPAATLKDIAEHFSVKIASIHTRLKQCGITRKKNLSV